MLTIRLPSAILLGFMKMPQSRSRSLRTALGNSSDCGGRFLWGIRSEVSLSALLTGSCLGGHRRALADRCVLLSTHDQLATAVALIELDGVARRMIVCPHSAMIICKRLSRPEVWTLSSRIAGLSDPKGIRSSVRLLWQTSH